LRDNHPEPQQVQRHDGKEQSLLSLHPRNPRKSLVDETAPQFLHAQGRNLKASTRRHRYARRHRGHGHFACR
jgi:hypothetical protein